MVALSGQDWSWWEEEEEEWAGFLERTNGSRKQPVAAKMVGKLDADVLCQESAASSSSAYMRSRSGAKVATASTAPFNHAIC
eukprot:2113905-Amphidinium_carterae.1